MTEAMTIITMLQAAAVVITALTCWTCVRRRRWRALSVGLGLMAGYLALMALRRVTALALLNAGASRLERLDQLGLPALITILTFGAACAFWAHVARGELECRMGP